MLSIIRKVPARSLPDVEGLFPGEGTRLPFLLGEAIIYLFYFEYQTDTYQLRGVAVAMKVSTCPMWFFRSSEGHLSFR